MSNTLTYPISQFNEYTVSIDSVQNLKGQLRVNVTLAAEMVQDYHISEIPWLKDKLPKRTEYIKVFKPYEELKKAVQDLEKRGIFKIPYVMPHSDGTFLKEQFPERLQKLKDKYDIPAVNSNQVVGWVKEFYFDDVNRKIKAWLYLPTSSEDSEYLEFLNDVKVGKVINVSIGFICDWSGAGEYNGIGYTLAQIDIQIGHLAGLIDARGKCPAGICGINQDQHFDSDHRPNYAHLLTHIVVNGQNWDSSTEQIEIERPIIIPECPCKKHDINVEEMTNVGSLIGLNNPSNLNKNNEASSMDEEELKKKKLEEEKAKKEKESANSSKDAELIATYIAELNDSKLKLGLAEKTIADQAKTIADQAAEIKVYHEQDKAKYIEQLGKDTEINGKKVSDMCVRDLSLLASYKRDIADKNLKDQGLPMPNQDAFNAKRNPISQPEKLKSTGAAFNGVE